MINDNRVQQIKIWLSRHPKEATTIILAISLFVSNLIIPIQVGLYFIFVLAVIIATILIGSMFLLYNTTILFLALLLKEGLSQEEKTWVNRRVGRNILIIVIWVGSSIITFTLTNQILGIIASILLVSLLLIFHVAGVEENPFLEKRYEI